MRILYLNPIGMIGGAEQVLLSMLAALRQSKPAADLHLLVCSEGPLMDRALALGVKVKLLSMPAKMAELGDSRREAQGGMELWGQARRCVASLAAVRRYTAQLTSVVEELSPDLIHSNGMKTHLLASLVTGRKLPVIWHLHDYCGARLVMSRALRWAHRRAAGAIAISQSVADDAMRTLPRFPIQVILNTIDTAEFSPAVGDAAALDHLAGLPGANSPSVVRVGLVATFARWKGQDTFLHAAAQLMVENPALPVRFYIVGGPIYQTRGSQFSEAELRKKAAELQISDRLGFVEFQPRTTEIYRALDIVVHASTRPEPFGLTIAEAMACARPVIAVQEGGAAELFTHGHDAWGIPAGQPCALACAIQELVRDPALRHRLATNARQTTVDRFSRARLPDQLCAFYGRFLKPHPAGLDLVPLGHAPEVQRTCLR